MRVMTFPWTTAFATTTTRFIPVTPWLDASQVEKVRAVFEVYARTGGFKCQPGFQTANHADDTPTGSGTAFDGPTWADGDDVYYPAGWKDMTTDLAGKQLVRFGFRCEIETGQMDFARLTGKFEIHSCS